VLLVRGSRAVVVALAAAWIAVIWHVNTDSLAHQNPTVTRILYGSLKSVVVLLLADLVWHLARAHIDRTLATSADTTGLSPADMARRSRLRTLLPIIRNGLAAMVAVMAGLIVLSELGVEIGPLIAGAGIFGVAIGFGSQTLVKDVISGIFYMLDDAFRVGEYIQAKNYKGTVEGFSLRSVRLRHHRGPVFTIPFGELGAVENMSRDWVIDKFRISVGYNTDIAKARKITKAIGAELQADPEVGPLFIEPLKMKGVEEFGDYGIVLSFAMTTVPGQQTYIRRKAYAMIRDAFQANGIEFAQPTVQVGGDDKGGGAAAATAVRATQLKQQAAEGE
jgi:small-conductance mechanosensitive channel